MGALGTMLGLGLLGLMAFLMRRRGRGRERAGAGTQTSTSFELNPPLALVPSLSSLI